MIDAIYLLTQFQRERLSLLARAIALGATLDIPVHIVSSATCVTPDNFRIHRPIVVDSLATEEPAYGMARPGWDIGSKRKAIFTHAESNNYDVITMIDDDLYVDADNITEHSNLITQANIVYSMIKEYPDNSILYHADRYITGKLRTMPSGSLMTININSLKNKFINIYNEDWVFAYCNKQSKLIVASKSPKQLAYNPFSDPLIASWQELYDLFAEGLASAYKKSINLNDPNFWNSAIKARLNHYNHLINLCRRKEVLTCLYKGLNTLEEIKSIDCINLYDLVQSI